MGDRDPSSAGGLALAGVQPGLTVPVREFPKWNRAVGVRRKLGT